MDVVESVQACVQNWETGGESECRDILNAPHCNPSDPNSNDVLSTAYHTLITSTLQTWSPTKALSPQSLTDFIQSVLERLPSPSSAKSSNAVVFGELLVDLIWSIDVDIDEVYQDAKLALANAEQGKTPVVAEGSDPAEVLAKVAQAKKNAEVDKETLGNFVRQLVSLGVLDSNVCRERLELPMISQAGLVLDDHAFGKKEVRARTALFYKQNKFNLLREQSEGYSKLTTELTSRIGPPHSPATGIPVESFSAIEARAKPAWERIVGLVGYFDLDPNRALDIILDVFSVHLMTHYAFFLSLLSFSPWASSPPKTTDTMSMDSLSDPEIYRGRILDDILRLAELQNGKAPRVPQSPASMGANHCRVLAQVLGFKFVYYQALDVPEQTPKNLYLTAALLIREGFITLEDIYPHITPTDGEMEDNLHKQYLASVASRISGAKVSLLAMAAPLESSSSSNIKTQQTTPAETKSTKPEVKEVPNQKLGLLNALLALGALRPALTMLSKFPWMVDAFPEIADLMLRILKHSIAPVYESYQPEGLYQFRGDVSSFATPRSRYGPSGVTPPSERKPYLTLWAPTPPPTSAADFVFFFPQWTDRIPVCKSIEDIKDVLEPLMRFVGIMVHRDLAFFTRFVRLGRSQLSTVCPDGKKVNGDADPEHPIRRFWFKAARRYMLPSLPLIRGNAVTTVEAMKSATLMGFDVMMYAALDALANPNKNRVKDDGVNSSDWLLSLSSFIGLLFTRYSVDLTPILQYIVHQLHNGQTTEIVVLRELIWKMAGIEPLPSLSDSQIAAMGGGPTLRAEAIASSSRGSRSEPGQNKNAPKRLGDALLESQLALPLLIQSLASLYDTTHGVLLQYLELLTSPSIVPAQIYAEKVLPSLIELNKAYGRFLLGVLTDLWKWHQDEALFMQDNRVKSGGKVTYLPGFLWRFSNKPAVAIGDIISWDQFRTVFKKWHRKIVKCFVECIETGEFMHVYNTIIVLKEILPVFPLAAVNETSGATLDAAIDRFVEKEERGDLKILGRAYAASLKKREPMWAPPAKIAKSIPSAPSAKSSPVPPQVPDKPRSTIPPSAPNSSVTTDARRTNITLPASTPSAPRAHVNGSGPPSGTQASSTQSPASMKAAIESIPRPEVVKRIRPDNRSPVAKVNGDSESGVNGKADAMNVDTPVKPRKDEPATPRGPSGVANGGRPSSPALPSGILPPIPRSISQQFAASATATPIVDDRGLPSRPDASRRREEDSLGKRRRPTEDDDVVNRYKARRQADSRRSCLGTSSPPVDSLSATRDVF
ncbi:hypothetical protein EW026_g445 [Hermanssonia centrifuga]|uniref:Uncharacterized protein n=1 Tax=Hermanssonia centrifuga TaxID=98765 RepID=A0A4S4KUQ0_9APHY|nr:hypothetical protein EW026_g445 [Hermanssonia centrifuga]